MVTFEYLYIVVVVWTILREHGYGGPPMYAKEATGIS